MVVSTEELQHRLSEVLERFEALANRLDMTYVRRDVFDAYKELMSARLDATRAEREALGTRQTAIEDDRVAKNRLVWGAFISAVVSVVVAVLLAVLLHGGK